jgi:DNA-binding Lrp family transcriptional regulator
MDGSDVADRAVINGLQGGFPLDQGKLCRFGPLWNAQTLGGDVCLCAMAVPSERFDAVAGQVNAHPEVAHNYERTHALNMWFVLAAERPERIEEVAAAIELETGIAVHRMPKLNEFFVGFRVEV